jgi:hypothetical protein
MKTLYFSILFLFTFSLVSAQNITDVVRWSSIDPSGTARTMGAGSSFGAMGGDFSVININPAGIGDYRSSEFTFTPSLNMTNTDAFFISDKGSLKTNKRSGLSLDNLGFVISRNNSRNWTTSNFAFGYSKISSLRNNIRLEGKTPGSITNMFAEKANTLTPDELDDFVAYPAYNVGAIFDFDDDKNYDTDFAQKDQLVLKSQLINQKGGINEFTFGWAGEYKNKMNLGISIGVPFASFEELKKYSESDPADEIATFKSLDYTERLNTSGVGFNFKTGFVYKITPFIRFGGAFHSPTWFKFTDDYSTSIEYSFQGNTAETFSYDSPDGTFDYKITNPWRAIGSVGTLYKLGGIVGFLNADIEFVDYTTASYNGSYTNDPVELSYTKEVNEQILTRLASTTNLRLGTELGYKNLRLRAGYSWDQSPFNADVFYNNKVSLGLGFRDDNFFLDLGIRFSDNTIGYNAYVVQDSELDPLSNIETKRTRAALTLGFKF